MTNKLGSSIGVINLRTHHDLVVGQTFLLLDGVAFRSPLLGDLVEVFVVVDWNRFVDVVANGLASLIAELLFFGSFLLYGLLLLLEIDLLLEQFCGILLVLVDVSGDLRTSWEGRTFFSCPISFWVLLISAPICVTLYRAARESILAMPRCWRGTHSCARLATG